MPHIFLNIRNSIYEVSHFTDSHKGEGINNVFLREHNRQNVTSEFEKFHTSEIADDELELAKKGQHPMIKYIGPNYFQKNIPKYFHLIDMEVADVEDISKLMSKKSYFIFPSFDDDNIFNLSLFVKDANGCVNIYPLILKHSDSSYPQKVTKCSVELYDIELNDKLEDENIITTVLEAGDIESFVDKYFTKQGYTSHK